MSRTAFLTFLLAAPIVLAASRPAPPVILEPAIELQAVHGADVHMVTEQISDADGDEHLCTDWQIRDGEEVVWTAPCVIGGLIVHIHLGDGVFTGNHTGADEMRAESQFEMRVRHRDDSGDPETEWSEWSSRRFQTVKPTPVTPMRVDEVLLDRAPLWKTTAGEEISVPSDAALDLQTVDGEALLRFGSSEVHVAEPRATPALVLLRVAAGDAAWNVPESELAFEDGHGELHSIYLPALALQPRAEALYWVSANGSTHIADAVDRTPNFEDIARGAPVPWTVERGFRADVFSTGLELPVAIAFVPNPGDAPESPLLYVAELYGAVRVVTRNGESHEFASGLLNFDPRAPIPGNGERGLGGITIDPANGDVLVTAVHQLVPGSPWASPRVLRLQSDDGGLTAARIVPVIEFNNEQMAPSHQISTLSFGPDDKLYVQVGSTFSWIAQDMNTIDGKILRINRDGSAPTDNPFYDAANGISATDYIFALGFRNPFGGAWRAADQSLYEVENGPTTDRLAMVVGGRNYLWDGTDPSMRNHAVFNWNEPVAPIQIAFTEPERFHGSGFPASKMRSAFVTESGATWASGPQHRGKRISELVLDLDGAPPLEGPKTFAIYTGSGKATAAGMAAGPDGLYFTDLYRDFGEETPFDRGASLLRIRYVGYADFDAHFQLASTIALTDRSNVPDAESVTWDFGDGTISNERNPKHKYASAGTYVIRQTVTGPRGTVTHAQRVFAGGGTATINAEYFENETATTPLLTRAEGVMNFDWASEVPSPLLPADGFAAKFTARVTPRFSETYTFTALTNDRVRVTLDGKSLIDAWKPEESGAASGEIELVAGRSYELHIEFVDASDTPSLRLTWESESQSTMTVPRSAAVSRQRAISPP